MKVGAGVLDGIDVGVEEGISIVEVEVEAEVAEAVGDGTSGDPELQPIKNNMISISNILEIL